MMAEPTTKPTAVPPMARKAVDAGAEGIGAQHRQRAQDHPEAVLDIGDLHDGDRQRQPGRAAYGIAEPHRAE